MSRDLWLLAGQDLLREHGVKGVKLRTLAASLDLTTGSFYHHFTGMGAYLDELARYYGANQMEASLADAHRTDPVERLRNLARISRNDRMGPLDAAMRDWAGSNELAAEAVRRADERLLAFVEQTFVDLGHDVDGARTRALMFISVGVARVSPPWRVPRGTIDQILEILT